MTVQQILREIFRSRPDHGCPLCGNRLVLAESTILTDQIAFRPICSLLFLAETAHFAFLGGKRKRIKDNKKCIFGTFWSPFLPGHF